MNRDEFVIVGYIRCAEPGCQRRAAAIMRRDGFDLPYISRKYRLPADGGGREMAFYEPVELFKIGTNPPGDEYAACPRCGWLEVDEASVLSAFRDGTPERPREVHALKRRAW